MERVDPEMLKYLDLLIHLDVLEQEENWELMEDMEPSKKERHKRESTDKRRPQGEEP